MRLYRAPVLILRKFLAALAILTACTVLTTPAAAARSHHIEHIPSPIAVGQHHDHAGDVGVDMDEDDPASEQSKDKTAPGHAHPPISAADLAMPGAGVLTQASRIVPRQQWILRELSTLNWSPARRPPRTA